MLHKAFSTAGSVEMHHEYMVNIVQPLAVRRYLDLTSNLNALEILQDCHLNAVHYSAAAFWGDSSNKLSWLIPELAELLPEARFVHLVRDGRKVASSYLHKLGDECYDDRSNAILQAHYDDPVVCPAPPPEKRYWWPVPRRGDAMAQAFRDFNQFERIAWHWAEINAVILKSLAKLASERHLFVRLEDLLVSPALVRSMFEFIGLSYRDDHFAIFARPHNVNRPEDHPLTQAQRVSFDRIASPMMDRLGYAERAEYVVNY